MHKLVEQLDLLGFEETLRQQTAMTTALSERRRIETRVRTAHDLLSSLPEPTDLQFLHSGLCQTFLPHSRPVTNHSVWKRSSGKLTLMITPGVIQSPSTTSKGKDRNGADDSLWVGVPFGARARLVLIHLQTEGQKSRVVNLGDSISAFIRSLGLPVTGGANGTLPTIREQCLRIARCTFTMQWSEDQGDGVRTVIKDNRIVSGLDLWHSGTDKTWKGEVELSAEFHANLKEHSVPLDRRAIAHLSGNSLGLDLYSFLAYRLNRLSRPLMLRWSNLQDQIGSDYTTARKLGQKVRETLPDVLSAYPQAQVEVVEGGLLLRHSPTPVPPKTAVHGLRLIPKEQPPKAVKDVTRRRLSACLQQERGP